MEETHTEIEPPVPKTEEHLREWFEKDVLPRIVKDGKFPVDDTTAENLTIADVSWEITERFTDHFASCPYFVRLRLQNSTDPTKTSTFHIIVKFITQNIATRKAMETDVQFQNETEFYNKLIPEFKKYLAEKGTVSTTIVEEMCPRCYYANIDTDDVDYALVVLNDMRNDGFSTAKSKVELDFHHLLVSFKQIGRFHALSYAMKLDQPDQFEKLKTLFIECRYQEDRYKEHYWSAFLSSGACRGIDYLLKNPDSGVPADYLNKLREKVTTSPYKLMQEMMKLEEPLSVICHGDFCRNNILFKLENGKAVDCKLFDFQTFRYANPAIDLTFFLYLNSTLEVREKHFNDLMAAYHESLTTTLSKITARSLSEILELYPKKLFLKDFGDRSLWGYMISSFFLPMMMSPGEIDENDFHNLSSDQLAEKNAKQGGEPVTVRIAEVVKDLYNRGFYL